jgi:NADP-reducing hydrogenase subunit HndA
VKRIIKNKEIFIMANERIDIPYNGTPEQEAQLAQLLADYKNTKSPLIPVLEQAQDIFGYLPEKVLKIISEELNVSLGKIYGVVTFYSFFSLYPKGKYEISVCLGTACYVKGSGEIYAKLQQRLGITGGQCTADGKYSLDACRCIGACGLAPVLTVNGEVYGRLTVNDVDDILAKYE